jgi:hypothetical protein
VISFIELPRLGFDGRDAASVLVNTADIITLEAKYDGQTRIEVRGIGSQGVTGSITTYAPLSTLLDALNTLAEMPGVHSWDTQSVAAWAAPIKVRLAEGAARERTVR